MRGRPFVHERYNASTSDSDIALIQLRDRQIGSDRWIGILQRADEQRLLRAGSEAVVTGWGRTFDTNLLDKGMYTQKMWEEIDNPKTLSFTRIPIVGFEGCRQVGDQITANMVCAGGTAARGPCQGDSGGPLLVTANNARRYLQVGIVSRHAAIRQGAICGQPGYPAAFTLVSRYNDWIAGIMRNNRW
jgi:secreted trypsin-like serine protease